MNAETSSKIREGQTSLLFYRYITKNLVKKLAAGETLPTKNKDHQLIGNYVGCRECHIAPDWLLIYEIADEQLILYLARTGTHSDLFGK